MSVRKSEGYPVLYDPDNRHDLSSLYKSYICSRIISPDVDHKDGVVPCMIQGIVFLKNLSASN
jgi:hypothetical protein